MDAIATLLDSRGLLVDTAARTAQDQVTTWEMRNSGVDPGGIAPPIKNTGARVSFRPLNVLPFVYEA